MCDCSPFIQAIQEGGSGLEQALLEITKGKDPCGFRKTAYYVHKHFCGLCKGAESWENLMYEALIRFIRAVERGKGPVNSDCRPFFFQISKNTCMEWNRREKKQGDISRGLEEVQTAGEAPTGPKTPEESGFPIEDLVVLMAVHPELNAAVLSCLESIGSKSRLLLTLRFFDQPNLEDHQLLSEALNKSGYQVQTRVIPAEITNSKARLRKCLKEKLRPLYDDLKNR